MTHPHTVISRTKGRRGAREAADEISHREDPTGCLAFSSTVTCQVKVVMLGTRGAPKVKTTCFKIIGHRDSRSDSSAHKLSRKAAKSTKKKLPGYEAHTKYRRRSKSGHKMSLCVKFI